MSSRNIAPYRLRRPSTDAGHGLRWAGQLVRWPIGPLVSDSWSRALQNDHLVSSNKLTSLVSSRAAYETPLQTTGEQPLSGRNNSPSTKEIVYTHQMGATMVYTCVYIYVYVYILAACECEFFEGIFLGGNQKAHPSRGSESRV